MVHDLATGQDLDLGVAKVRGQGTVYLGLSSTPGLVLAWPAPPCGSSGLAPCGSGTAPELAVLNLAAIKE
ncbi:hypothetical protein HD597_000824 [Nonomuraea thailandensis]|uniref:Uncharacterized protein n=1 Tax=Nonomuraea thailandensis TaxID=1188745 RepID=A0A9X2G741_9ACTN|nr:hypothetical protein [Nonomuraea thailandensis]MCP2353804.1 hypothetical protein [Nonomuraea thailandensis]